MTESKTQPIYEIAINARISWQAHSLSNAGSDGSNRIFPRRQLLADGLSTDACSGAIAKHYHAAILAEYMDNAGIKLCAPCAEGDNRRAGALAGVKGYENLTIDDILATCGLCDVHGFLVTGKKGKRDGATETRQRLAKHSLIDFSFALALPDHHAESVQLRTRSGTPDGEGQMLIKNSVRSGDYAFCVRYKSAGVGMDTNTRRLVVDNEEERRRRHCATLAALRDQIVSPSGAMTATLLPHLTGMMGAIVVRTSAGRAPLYSPLANGFIDQLMTLADRDCHVYPFGDITSFHRSMRRLIDTSMPAGPVVQTAISK